MIIPIGIQCTSAIMKGELEKTHTLPFDWMFSTPAFVFEMLQLLLEKNGSVEELVKDHFFKCDKRANLHGVEHYRTCDDGFAYVNTTYNVVFPHDSNTMDTIQKYIRRFERLKEIVLHSTECIYFIYTSQSSLEHGNFTIDGVPAIKDVYFHLSNLYTLIGKFRNNYKMIVFDAIQEETGLHENITLIPLHKCNGLSELLPQMKEHKHVFMELIVKESPH